MFFSFYIYIVYIYSIILFSLQEINICKFSECGTLLAASSIYGEIIVWNVENKELIGYIEHQQNAKITALSWNIDKSDEIAFCDSLGQLGCIDIVGIYIYIRCKLFNKFREKLLFLYIQIISDKATSNEVCLETNGDVKDNNVNILEEEDDDEENVISLNKIKALVELDDDQKSHSDVLSEKSKHDTNTFIPEIHLQSPFQPGSSPAHLLSRFMVKFVLI